MPTYSNKEPIPKWQCPKHPRAEVKKTWVPMVDNVTGKHETNNDGTDLELPIPDKWGTVL